MECFACKPNKQGRSCTKQPTAGRCGPGEKAELASTHTPCKTAPTNIGRIGCLPAHRLGRSHFQCRHRRPTAFQELVSAPGRLAIAMSPVRRRTDRSLRVETTKNSFTCVMAQWLSGCISIASVEALRLILQLIIESNQMRGFVDS